MWRRAQLQLLLQMSASRELQRVGRQTRSLVHESPDGQAERGCRPPAEARDGRPSTLGVVRRHGPAEEALAGPRQCW